MALISRKFPSLDAETRLTGDHHDALRLWLRLFATANLVSARVRNRLQQQFDTTLPRFDLLAQLERAPEGLKMGEISRRMMVTGGNVTGIVDALEADGLVSRLSDPNDRRASRVRLTSPGRKAFRTMAQAHERWIIEAFRGVDRSEVEILRTLLGKVKMGLMTSGEEQL